MTDAFSQLKIYNSYQEFFSNHPDRLYRLWVYRRVFTPVEQDRKYIDQSIYEDDHACVGVIREVIPLPDGDLLLGFASIADSITELTEVNRCIGYYRLSEIRLNYMPMDVDRYAEE